MLLVVERVWDQALYIEGFYIHIIVLDWEIINIFGVLWAYGFFVFLLWFEELKVLYDERGSIYLCSVVFLSLVWFDG